ncbi:MAG: hypothetical protein GY944_17885, partial [bacterium]|nr:hypothetical protein [bacterium]
TSYEIECYGGLQPLPGRPDQPVNVVVDPLRAVFDVSSWGEAAEVRSDNLALLGSEEDGLRIVDVSDPTTPSEIGFFDPVECRNETPFGSELLDFAIEEVALDPIDEDIVYLSAGACGLFIVDLDVQFPIVTPTVISIIDTDGWTEHLELVADTAFIADYNGGVLSFDLSDRASPVPLDVVAYDNRRFGAALDLAIEGDFAYVASDKGLRVIDISNPSQMSIETRVDTDVDNGFVPQGIMVFNDLAFLSSWEGGLLVFDVAGPPQLLPDRRVGTDYAFYKLVIDEVNELLYIAEGPRGIKVVDISGVDSGGRYLTVEQIDIGKFVWDVGLENGQIFVGFGNLEDFSGGFQTIIDRR